MGPGSWRTGDLRQSACLWVRLCPCSNNCWACAVPELVPTCWGARSHHGANKLEGRFQNATCQPQTPFGTHSQQWLLPESLSAEWVHVVLRLSKMSKWIWPKLLSNYCFCTGPQECVTFCSCPLRAEFFSYSPSDLPKRCRVSFQSPTF